MTAGNGRVPILLWLEYMFESANASVNATYPFCVPESRFRIVVEGRMRGGKSTNESEEINTGLP